MTAFVLQPHRPALRGRQGLPPLATRPFSDDGFPHQQLTQVAPDALQEQLFARITSLPGLKSTDSVEDNPGCRAFVLDEDFANGPSAAFQATTEFAHLHPGGDGSFHLTLPRGVRDAVFAAGWGEAHPVSGLPLIYGPRTDEELEVIWQILIVSYRFAVGDLGDADAAYEPGATASQTVAPAAAPAATEAPAASGSGWIAAETFGDTFTES